jgi:SAM-dependent methyltransferase
MLYDTIGKGYATQRVPDPRIANQVLAALGPAATVINVGAGTGSYEPRERSVIAVEPSMTMIRQRPAGAPPVIQAMAEQLPFPDGVADASMAVLTVHHWRAREAGLAELARVARDRVVILTWDPEGPQFWLTREYFPELAAADHERFPTIAELSRVLGPVHVEPVQVPRDCIDGFLGAYWGRPSAYLDPVVRAGMSGFNGIEGLSESLDRLAADLASGAWHRRFGERCSGTHLDIGYRLVIASLQ